MLLPRLITAIIGIPLVVFSIYWGGIPFFIMILGIVLLSLQEYFVLVSKGEYRSQPVIGICAGLVLFISIFLNTTTLGPQAQNQATPFVLSLILIPIFAREIIRKQHDRSIERLAITFFGVFFIPWSLGHLILIRNLRPSGMSYIIFLFALIWILDTGAYAIGKRFGSHKLAAEVSPKKTIEGAIGGSVTAVLTGLVCHYIFLKDFFVVGESLGIAFIVSIISQFSDLSESLLKRDAGVKDSANLLPGHGGMLDRFDSFIFTAPILYYYLTIFKGN